MPYRSPRTRPENRPRSAVAAITSIAAAIAAAGCGGPDSGDRAREAYASTYRALPAPPTLIREASVLTGTGERLEKTDVLLDGGRIVAVGERLKAPRNAGIVDAAGKWVTPGIVDVHSHLGVYPSPQIAAVADGNEMIDPNTAGVWAEHAVWPQDPGFVTALAGGVTALQILPGSANLFGGRTVTLKNVPARTVQAMKFPGAPHGLKMACGENPKRVYGTGREQAPMTRMGNVAGYRSAWIEAADYREKRTGEDTGDQPPPARDLAMETLVGVLEGEILVHNHCYRADEMAVMLDVAREFGYRVTAFHHAVESYKIADLLASEGVCSAMWADWWGFKLEAYDTVRENVAFVDAAGACAIVHSDSQIGIQRLNQEAAKALAAGRRAGLELDEADAIAWITLNPARALGIDAETGSIEPGKMADVVVWDRNPFSVYAHAERVYIDGALVWDRDDPARQPVTDFSLGTAAASGGSR